jgi:hypothetical protein
VASERGRRWARYLAEFVVIFLGVSLSFFAEDLRENRRDRHEERASLVRLHSNLTESDFENELTRTSLSLSGIERILAVRDSARPSADSLSAWLSDAAACTPVVVNRSEYESLRSSGKLSLLRDADLRRLLTAHYERYNAVLDLSRRECDFSYMRPIASSVRVVPRFSYPRYVVTGDVSAILMDDTFMMEIGHLHQVKNVLRTRYRIMDAQRDTLLHEVNALLEHR